MRALRPLLPGFVAALTACLPYTVGTTASPVARGESVGTMSSYIIPNAVELFDDTLSHALAGVDLETRFGLDGRSDVGVRLPSMSGIVVNYKRRLGSDTTGREPGVALMGGAGFVNWAQHAHLEATLLASGRESDVATAYGGLRVMQVVPIARGAVHDSPTAGGFLGVRLGAWDLGISPEIGIFYDRSALGVRRGDVVFVPAVSLHRGASRRIRAPRGPTFPPLPGRPRR